MLILFDLDGTLVKSSEKLTIIMANVLESLRAKGNILGIVGGGSFTKIMEQLNGYHYLFQYIFSECGSVIHKLKSNTIWKCLTLSVPSTIYPNNKLSHKLLGKKNIMDVLLQDDLALIEKTFMNSIYTNDFIKKLNIEQYNYLSNTNGYVDVRQGLIYLSPVGMKSTMEYRSKYLDYKLNDLWRTQTITELKNLKIPGLTVVVGGQLGIAIYPNEWDKSQIVPFIKNHKDLKNEEIVFFGDKTDVTGNDYPLYNHTDVIGYSVYSPENTLAQLDFLYFN